MRVWEVQDAWGIDHLKLVERADPSAPSAGQVAIRMRAAAVNYRDLVTVTNKSPFGKLPQIPFSDGTGEIIATGAGVTRFKKGDRVCPNFFPKWIDGPPLASARAGALGSAAAAGVLQDIVIADAEAVSRIPDCWSWVEAATLPCAGLTAWRALVVEGQLKAGETVLVQGTGGVSIFALQFAKMLGARVIATSSSDAKLEVARKLGADHVINYTNNPEWGKAALELTKGNGVDLVVEVGGAGTINQSLVAAADGGRIMLIGVLGGRTQEITMPVVFGKNLRLIGISVGNRSHFEQMTGAIAKSGMRPLIDKCYPFRDVPAAMRRMAESEHVGKICIDFDL